MPDFDTFQRGGVAQTGDASFVRARAATISPQGCTDLGGVAYRLCLPPRLLCDAAVLSGLLVEQGEAWCNTCQVDSPYAIPYVSGDTIQVQTQFFDSYNAEPKDPQSGFGSFVRAFVTDGVVRQEITTGMVAYGCGKSFQILAVDTSTVTLDCWVVELTAYNADGTERRTIQTQQFKRVPDTQAGQTFTIRGRGKGMDCYGNCYTAPTAYVGELIEYDNTLRFYGTVRDTGGNFDAGGLNGGYFATKTIENYRLSLAERIPPFAKNLLLKVLLAAPEVVINGEVYDLDQFKVDNEVKDGTMFLFGVDLERKCGGGC
ncbi:hypothetical protein LEM8419_03560 [Neolewinella maritima]|uniref:Uncharacterized protein n=1 Tax=Neolewinella maritima TaxID=1383882 RepID=A0ABN8FEB3_9BACT|nr:hypothetical protein [Neolewinella maritima]CAH1002688.1 hypothetical protein LEM8419_03560 [Neolewinella maritima]